MEPIELLTRMPRNMWRTFERMNFPLDGLALYLPLWHPELSGSTIISKDLNALSCTVTGALHQPPLGRTLDGTDDEIAVPASAALTLPSGFTMWGWFKFTDVTTARYFAGIGYGVSVYDNAGDIRITAAGKIEIYWNRTLGVFTGRVGTTVLNNTDFYNITAVHMPNAAPLLYINTVAEGSTSGTTGTMASATNWKVNIGWSAYEVAYKGTPMKGVCGEFHLVSGALSLGQIQHNERTTRWRYT